MSKPLVVCFEGMDGCGKSTLLKYIEASLIRDYPDKHIVAMDIFGNDREVKGAINSAKEFNIETLLALLSATTKTLYKLVPYLIQEGTDIVLIDRGRASFYAYQCMKGEDTTIFIGLSNYVCDQDVKYKRAPNYVYIKSSIDRCERLMSIRDTKTAMDKRSKEDKLATQIGYDLYFDNLERRGCSEILTIDADRYEINEVNEKAYQLFKEKFVQYLD